MQSFDTVGWFARDPDTLRRVGRALLDPAPSPVCPTEWVMARDLWELADSETASSLLGFVQKTVMADDSPVGGFIEGVTLSSR